MPAERSCVAICVVTIYGLENIRTNICVCFSRGGSKGGTEDLETYVAGLRPEASNPQTQSGALSRLPPRTLETQATQLRGAPLDELLRKYGPSPGTSQRFIRFRLSIRV